MKPEKCNTEKKVVSDIASFKWDKQVQSVNYFPKKFKIQEIQDSRFNYNFEY
jgi:hypothetical protein